MPNPILSIVPADPAFLNDLYNEVRAASKTMTGGLERQVRRALEVREVSVEDPTPEIVRRDVVIYGKMYQVYVLKEPQLIDVIA